MLFVGINPGLRSAATGHHFAGYSNRFWKLLFESGLVPEPITYQNDARLPEWSYGVTNIVPRATAGIDELKPVEYQAGARAVVLGFQTLSIEGARVCVLPNPSGRNATLTYPEMLKAYRILRGSC